MGVFFVYGMYKWVAFHKITDHEEPPSDLMERTVHSPEIMDFELDSGIEWRMNTFYVWKEKLRIFAPKGQGS